jgi:inorganic pyrophosphatase
VLHELDPGPQCPEIVRMIVEIPKNSKNKYEYDTKLGVFRLDRTLYSPMHYPGDYGFVCGTRAEDGDPTDVLVSADEATFTGCMLEVRPVGLLEMVDEKGPDEKILAVPDRNPRYDQIHTIDQIFPHVLREIEHFFDIYKDLEGKPTEIKGWRGPKEARQRIVEARERYLNRKTPKAVVSD